MAPRPWVVLLGAASVTVCALNFALTLRQWLSQRQAPPGKSDNRLSPRQLTSAPNGCPSPQRAARTTGTATTSEATSKPKGTETKPETEDEGPEESEEGEENDEEDEEDEEEEEEEEEEADEVEESGVTAQPKDGLVSGFCTIAPARLGPEATPTSAAAVIGGSATTSMTSPSAPTAGQPPGQLGAGPYAAGPASLAGLVPDASGTLPLLNGLQAGVAPTNVTGASSYTSRPIPVLPMLNQSSNFAPFTTLAGVPQPTNPQGAGPVQPNQRAVPSKAPGSPVGVSQLTASNLQYNAALQGGQAGLWGNFPAGAGIVPGPGDNISNSDSDEEVPPPTSPPQLNPATAAAISRPIGGPFGQPPIGSNNNQHPISSKAPQQQQPPPISSSFEALNGQFKGSGALRGAELHPGEARSPYFSLYNAGADPLMASATTGAPLATAQPNLAKHGMPPGNRAQPFNISPTIRPTSVQPQQPFVTFNNSQSQQQQQQGSRPQAFSTEMQILSGLRLPGDTAGGYGEPASPDGFGVSALLGGTGALGGTEFRAASATQKAPGYSGASALSMLDDPQPLLQNQLRQMSGLAGATGGAGSSRRIETNPYLTGQPPANLTLGFSKPAVAPATNNLGMNAAPRANPSAMPSWMAGFTAPGQDTLSELDFASAFTGMDGISNVSSASSLQRALSGAGLGGFGGAAHSSDPNHMVSGGGGYALNVSGGMNASGGIPNPMAGASARLGATLTPPSSLFAFAVGADTLQISSKWPLKSLAGALAGRMRKGEAVILVISPIGGGSEHANHCLKALCVARTFLKPNSVDISCRIEWSNETFALLCYPGAYSKESDAFSDDLKIRIAGKSAPPPLHTAGLIANRLREHGICFLLVMGAEAVIQAMRSMCVVHNFVGNDLPVWFLPKFITVSAPTDSRSGIQVYVHQNTPAPYAAPGGPTGGPTVGVSGGSTGPNIGPLTGTGVLVGGGGQNPFNPLMGTPHRTPNMQLGGMFA